MFNLSERQRVLLSLIIHEYVRTANPVGSQNLVGNYKLDLSSATVRNEMTALTEMGLLRQPHPSAGRIPTEEGYRYFVSSLIQDTTLPETTRSTITHQFYQMRNDVDQWMRLAASVLAQQSHVASLITSPHPSRARLKHVEIISTRGRQVLMVLVMYGGEIHQRIQSMSEPVTQEQLSTTGNHLTQILQGLEPDAITARMSTLTGLEQDMAGWILEEMTRSDRLMTGEIYLDGFSNMLAEPEFAGSEDARKALQVLEERPKLENLLSRTVLNGAIGGVQVLIGGENARTELRQCSIILARYGSPDLATGMLGVMGPMRMSYGRSISVVRFVTGLLSDLVSETLIDDETISYS
jgi:heat-inducible transcriptional repressor